jgi:S-adenosylmethionine hydrolase
MRTCVTLTTDFGTRDSYVAELKGVLYSAGSSSLEVVDLTHEIGAQNVLEAAMFARAAWPRFPAGTIHLVIVDPGVGSSRRALALEHNGQFGLGPDNGVLSLWCGDAPRAFELQPERYVSRPVSATFHGRDVFAPAAARIAHGTPLHTLGRELSAAITRVRWPSSAQGDRHVLGEVVHVDRFGNLISNVARSDIARLVGDAAIDLRRLRVRVAQGAQLPLVRYYADAPGPEPIALVGSSEWLEIAVPSGSATERLSAGVGSAVRVEWVAGAPDK